MLEFPEQDRIDIVFQSCVETMALGLFLIGLIPDPSVDERVADRIGDIMADKSRQKRRSFFLLLPRMDLRKLQKAVFKEVVDLILMHMGTDVAVVPVPQDRNIIKEDIRSLKTKLVKPTVFCNDKFKVVLRHVVVCLHA